MIIMKIKILQSSRFFVKIDFRLTLELLIINSNRRSDDLLCRCLRLGNERGTLLANEGSLKRAARRRVFVVETVRFLARERVS